jgi:hypothetical protein
MAQDRIMDESLTEAERLEAAITAQQSNARRTALIRNIDAALGDQAITTAVKSYE